MSKDIFRTLESGPGWKHEYSPFAGRSNVEIYLEWVNDFLTIQGMADYYGVDRLLLQEILKTGKERHEKDIL